MTIIKNERLTKNYVDTSIDAQRQYTESLFTKASARVVQVVNDTVDAKLKSALAVIRPVEPTKMPMVADKNAECLEVLRRRMEALATHFEFSTGLRVHSVKFIHVGNHFVARPLVHNL